MIPIYRAKSIMSKKDEYVIGNYIENSVDCPCIIDSYANQYEIDKSTLSIHFPDMLDLEGTDIFASLSEDGNGGDILDYRCLGDSFGSVRYEDGFWCARGKEVYISIQSFALSKVTGIQE